MTALRGDDLCPNCGADDRQPHTCPDPLAWEDDPEYLATMSTRLRDRADTMNENPGRLLRYAADYIDQLRTAVAWEGQVPYTPEEFAAFKAAVEADNPEPYDARHEMAEAAEDRARQVEDGDGYWGDRHDA